MDDKYKMHFFDGTERPMTPIEKLALAYKEKEELDAGLAQIRREKLEATQEFADEETRYTEEYRLAKDTGTNTGHLRRFRDIHAAILRRLFERLDDGKLHPKQKKKKE